MTLGIRKNEKSPPAKPRKMFNFLQVFGWFNTELVAYPHPHSFRSCKNSHNFCIQLLLQFRGK